VQRQPNNAIYCNNLAAAYVKVQRLEDALRQVSRSVELDPLYVKAWAKKVYPYIYIDDAVRTIQSNAATKATSIISHLCLDISY